MPFVDDWNKLVMKYLSLIILLTISLTALAQERLISGKVTDESGMGLPGVTVQLKGTSTGTTTDLDGKYKINLNAGILRFSYIGFVPQEITITNQSSINIVLLEETKQLNEVVIIGYGTQKKSVVTGAISSVKSKDLEKASISRIENALQSPELMNFAATKVASLRLPRSCSAGN